MNGSVYIGETPYAYDEYTVPSDRSFRDAWQVDENQSIISVNMNVAREISREKIRLKRIKPLQELDTAYKKAMEVGASTDQIVSEKQALRDAPALPSIDAASTPEELLAIQPIPNVIID